MGESEELQRSISSALSPLFAKEKESENSFLRGDYHSKIYLLENILAKRKIIKNFKRYHHDF